ncbi:transposase [Lactobacillaceae bacterium Melli_B4]
MVKKFSNAFKKRIVTQYKLNNKSMAEIAREYGISLSALNRWVHDIDIGKEFEENIDSNNQSKLGSEISQLKARLSETQSILSNTINKLNILNTEITDLKKQTEECRKMLAEVSDNHDLIKKALTLAIENSNLRRSSN